MVKTDNLGLNLYEQGDTFRILGTGGLNESLQTIDEKMAENATAIEEVKQSTGDLKFSVEDGILKVTYDDGQ